MPGLAVAVLRAYDRLLPKSLIQKTMLPKALLAFAPSTYELDLEKGHREMIVTGSVEI